MRIELRGIELHGHHGVLADERERGQRFLVDLDLELADTTAAETDRIEDAVDYRDVLATVVEVSDARAYNLLESFATALADALLGGSPSSGRVSPCASRTSSWRGRSTTPPSSSNGLDRRYRGIAALVTSRR